MTDSSRTIVITGASDGIGAAAARRLTRDGHRVVVVGRSHEKTNAVADEIGADRFVSDFAELGQVRELATALEKAYPRIDVLANNAGGIFGDRTRTADGFEKTLQVNHLAPFLLTNLLLDTLTASRATVIATSSIAARIFSRLDLEDLDDDRDPSANRAYGNAKLENILFTRELQRRYGEQGISAVAFHPGTIATGFASESTSLMRFVYQTPLKHLVLRGPETGAEQLVWLATTTPGTDWEPGEYYEKRRITKTSMQAYDGLLAEGLWDESARRTGLLPGPVA
ncbi:SDR family NAD(P)-dependent oxidoreductase [Labedella endophytica]|uniref:SDR family NAD(P)-dependent oxidoreductase n=1 Tax=Labedella endophytica TaxID=1523160 RepID=A0A433JW18_9MICO|nr:SDR family NAD(P)-dependent oxidoreductase [Labedella endophytica]RUR03289.1 SDR family NAD(P)-dependent oxidoreductase [Labedella endophytica]